MEKLSKILLASYIIIELLAIYAYIEGKINGRILFYLVICCSMMIGVIFMYKNRKNTEA
jgi:hypothetical protein